MKKIIIFNFILLLITTSSLFAKSKDIFITHGGRLNSEGCHNDNKNNSKRFDEWRKISRDGFESNLYEANLHPMIRFIHINKI